MINLSTKPEGTRERIIAAAGMVFAEKGFRGTTVRRITARARVNLAAVNYHFRDKGELYVCVLKEAKRHVADLANPVGGSATAKPEHRLEEFIRAFVHRLLDPQRPAWHARVLTQEMSNPTPALGIVVRDLTGPLYRQLRAVIDDVVEGRASAAALDLLTLSVMGQCVFYVCSRPVIEQLAVDLTRASGRTERISQHIAAFSLAGLKDFRARNKPVRARSRARQEVLS